MCHVHMQFAWAGLERLRLLSVAEGGMVRRRSWRARSPDPSWPGLCPARRPPRHSAMPVLVLEAPGQHGPLSAEWSPGALSLELPSPHHRGQVGAARGT